MNDVGRELKVCLAPLSDISPLPRLFLIRYANRADGLSRFFLSLSLRLVCSLAHHLSASEFVSLGFLSSIMADLSSSSADCLVLTGARVVKQLGDNSCLFHSISFLLSYHDIVPSLHEMSSGFELRSMICSYIRDNPSTYISLAAGLISTIADALSMDNFNCLSYSEHLSDRRTWGGSLEIAIVAEMYSIGISVFLPVKKKRSFILLGSYRCMSFCSESSMICLLYSGNCHYDCLVDGELSSSFSAPVLHDHSSSNLSVQLSNYDLSIQRSLITNSSIMFPEVLSSSRRLSIVVDNNNDPCLPVSASSPRLLRAPCSPLISEQSFAYVNPLPPKSVVKSSCLTNRLKGYKSSSILCPSETKLNRMRRLEKITARRRNRLGFRKSLSKTAKDCASYSKYYDEGSQFLVCCVCGIEGGRSGYVSKDDIHDLILSSGLKERFSLLTTIDSSCSLYDIIYIEQMVLFFEDGLIKGLSSVCGLCVQQMKGRRVRSDVVISEALDVSHVEVNTSCDIEEAIAVADGNFIRGNPNTGSQGLPFSARSVDCLIPKFALFLGFFPGSIPAELIGLTPVEESMINIYSAVSKVTLSRGGHYKVKSSSTYTIINDLTSISRQLPRMPSLESIAVMRHKNTPIGKEYTYRPNRVYKALTWLKSYNHLYADIDLIWGADILFWQNTEISIDIPYIEISDEEVSEIDDELNTQPSMSDEFSTNSGKFVFIFIFIFIFIFFGFYLSYHFFFLIFLNMFYSIYNSIIRFCWEGD